MVSEPFLWLSGSCGHLQRSSATLAFIQLSLSEASHRRHAHSTCNTRISTFYAFNCQTTGIERQNGQSRAKPNQERPETASHAPPRASWSFCLTSTRSHAPPRAACTCHAPHAPTRASHAPHAPAAALSSYHVSPRWRHTATSSVDRWLWSLTLTADCWPLTLTIVKNFQPDLFCSVFRIDSDFELRFYIWGL